MARLAQRARAEDFRAIDRLVAEFESGANTFAGSGEALFCAYGDQQLIGCCGLNIDPYAGDPKVGRVRRLFVDREQRRSGVGRALVAAIEECAAGTFSVLQLFTTSRAAGRFYEALGYQAITDRDHVSHAKALTSASRPATSAIAPPSRHP